MDLQQTHQFPDGASIVDQGTLQPGTILQQRYQVVEIAGSGGMAVVYRARDLRFDQVSRICAIKEMYNTAPDPRLREMTIQSFKREANTLGLLQHPAIPSIIDYFSEGSRIYLVMEFIEGSDLEEVVENTEEPLDQDRVIDWAIQILDVLDYLHNNDPPFIFRDLKPSNIMLNQRDRIMLIDFGIAKVFEQGQRGTMIGTAGYPPPEQYRGLAEPRGDLYALGATMHHLLTKRDPRLEPPFSFHDHPIRQSNPDVSEAVEKIVMKALEYDIDKRFASAQEMKQALEALRYPAAVASVPAASGPSTVAFATSAISFSETGNVLPIWEFTCEDAIYAGLTVADGVLYASSYDHNLYAIDAKEGSFIWKFPTEDGLATQPHVWSERGLVFVGSEDHLMYAVFAEHGGIAWSAPTRDRIRSSPREVMGHVFFGSDDHCFYNLDARNGREVWKYETANYIRSSPAVSEELVYFGCDDTNVYALEIATSRQKWKFGTRHAVLSSPLLYEGFLFVGSMDWHVYCIDANQGYSVWNYRTGGRVISSPAISESLELVYAGSQDGDVYAIDMNKGREVWKFKTEGPVTSSPTVAEEAVYIGSTDGYLYCLDARSGDLRWKFYAGDRIAYGTAVWENTIFVAAKNGKIYALLL
jgi:outer membrane protein assembly factor BamB/tRNA A-37 threonylcarbamoyl transferase component Bud32